jgi:hypothetical protein
VAASTSASFHWYLKLVAPAVPAVDEVELDQLAVVARAHVPRVLQRLLDVDAGLLEHGLVLLGDGLGHVRPLQHLAG